MIKQVISFFLIAVAASSCSDKYQSYISRYHFASQDGKPDYASLNYWAAHPWKKDPSDSISKSLLPEVKDSSADVFFFILPPTPLSEKQKDRMLQLMMIISMLKRISHLYFTRPVYLTVHAGFLHRGTGRHISAIFIKKINRQQTVPSQ